MGFSFSLGGFQCLEDDEGPVRKKGRNWRSGVEFDWPSHHPIAIGEN